MRGWVKRAASSTNSAHPSASWSTSVRRLARHCLATALFRVWRLLSRFCVIILLTGRWHLESLRLHRAGDELACPVQPGLDERGRQLEGARDLFVGEIVPVSQE